MTTPDDAKLVEEPLLNKITALTRQIRARGDERSADAMLEIYAGVLSIACNCDDQKVMRKKAERARDEAVAGLAERDAAIAILKLEIDDLSYCLFCGEDLWTEEAVKIGLADKVGHHASDCPYLTLPATATSAARVIEAARRWGYSSIKGQYEDELVAAIASLEEDTTT